MNGVGNFSEFLTPPSPPHWQFCSTILKQFWPIFDPFPPPNCWRRFGRVLYNNFWNRISLKRLLVLSKSHSATPWTIMTAQFSCPDLGYPKLVAWFYQKNEWASNKMLDFKNKHMRAYQGTNSISYSYSFWWKKSDQRNLESTPLGTSRLKVSLNLHYFDLSFVISISHVYYHES